MQVPPFTSFMGIEVERREDGELVVFLDLAPHHLNRRGVAHGGVITALLDTALGAAVISSIPPEWWCATTSLTTQFIGGTGKGRLTASGRVSGRGARVAFATGEVRTDDDRVIASAQGTWHLWSHRPGRRDSVVPSAVVVMRDSGVLVGVGKIVAVGRNYAEHVAEMGAPQDSPPVLFLKPPSALTGAGAIAIPTSAGDVHHEVELVVAIGKGGKAIEPADALDHVLGYAVGLDLTLRDLQHRAKQRGEPWTVAKGFDGAAPVSPIAPRDEVGDASQLHVSLDVNGERKQDGSTSQMIHGVAELVAFASRWMTLERGDLLFTGTPSGVGPLCAGDRVVARIDKVGELALTIEADSDA